MTPDDDDLASTANLFSTTFELADQVAAQITPADTEKALDRIRASVWDHWATSAQQKELFNPWASERNDDENNERSSKT